MEKQSKQISGNVAVSPAAWRQQNIINKKKNIFDSFINPFSLFYLSSLPFFFLIFGLILKISLHSISSSNNTHTQANNILFTFAYINS